MQDVSPELHDDDLEKFAAEGAALLPYTAEEGFLEHDEFIKREHAEYLAKSIPGAELTILPGLPGVSHFASLQRAEQFSRALLAFLEQGSLA